MKQNLLPKLDDGFEWVIDATRSDRTSVQLRAAPPKEYEGKDKGIVVKCRTALHEPPVEEEYWKQLIIKTANQTLADYHECNSHAKWADELIRKSRDTDAV